MSYQYVTGDFTPKNIPKYHNIGQLKSPYFPKYGLAGDYGPQQGTNYHHNYPYPLFGTCPHKRFGVDIFHPEHYVPPHYFAPHTRYPSGHCN